jgi:2-polyprenyl-6-hydroxyphenyl methylase / 3-demethylubiquinone-9 3-methyltransferase
VEDRASSIDPGEVERFSALSDEWWDADGAFAPLHRMSHARMGFIREILEALASSDVRTVRPLEGLDVLDVGCGGGLLCEPMTRLGARVTGIDASAEAIAAATAHALESGLSIDFDRAAAEDLVERHRRFDAVVASEVIEHVADPARFLVTLAGLLKPGGVVVLTTLNRSAKSMVVAKVLAEYVLRVLPAGTHDWRKFLTPVELAAMMVDAGFTVKVERGIGYSISRDRFELGDDLSVNYAMAGVLGG